MTGSRAGKDPAEIVTIFGVPITNLTEAQAVDQLEGIIQEGKGRCSSVFIVNAHTLNLAANEPAYRDVLIGATFVFGDGTGVRWASRLRKVRIKANLVGTDLVPRLLTTTGGRGYSYYLLGADAMTIHRAAGYCQQAFPGWTLAGYHPGYLDADTEQQVIADINRLRPHLLLVGMGNPKQEQWIFQHYQRLSCAVAIGVGGLFDHWGGNLRRAPLWVRRWGMEWVQILLQQPIKKSKRYLIGNPLFLLRAFYYLNSDRRIS